MERIIRVAVIGSGGVGKTTCIQSFIDRKFDARTRITVGIDILTKTLNIDGNKVTILFYDMGGAPRFRCIRELFYKKLHAIVIMGDLARRFSIYEMRALVPEIVHAAKDDELCCIAIVGNKYDVSTADRQVVRELQHFRDLIEGENIARKSFTMMTSAKDLDSIDTLFISLVRCVMNARANVVNE